MYHLHYAVFAPVSPWPWLWWAPILTDRISHRQEFSQTRILTDRNPHRKNPHSRILTDRPHSRTHRELLTPHPCLLPQLCTLYSVLCTLYYVICTLYSVLCNLYSVLCILYSFFRHGRSAKQYGRGRFPNPRSLGLETLMSSTLFLPDS